MGLVHALRASAEAALGDDDGPLRGRVALDDVRTARAARRSLDLLEMLRERTAGNLTETERDSLWTALRAVRACLGMSPSGDDEGAAAEPGGPAASPTSSAAAGPSDPEPRP